MNTALLACVFVAAGVSAARAQMISYEGPPAKRTAALQAYAELKNVCPRIAGAAVDIQDYSLHVGLPELPGVYGEVARRFDAREILIVSIRFKAKTRTVPLGILTGARFVNIAIINADEADAMLTEPAAFWLCDKHPEPGNSAALLPIPAAGVALDR